MNFVDNEIVINQKSGEKLEINKEYIENVAKEKCKVNYDYIKSELSEENTKWVVEFYENDAMVPAQTIILDKEGKIIEIRYAE